MRLDCKNKCYYFTTASHFCCFGSRWWWDGTQGRI